MISSIPEDKILKSYKIEKEFVYKNYNCAVLFMCYGYRCGYVEIPKIHSLYYKDYMEVEINTSVHGGITFSGRYLEEPNTYCFGFDCNHWNDKYYFDLSVEYGLLPKDDELVNSIIQYNKISENLEMLSDNTLDYCIEQCKVLADDINKICDINCNENNKYLEII